MMILEPISIATGGYVGIGPPASQYCPRPLAIGSDGYIRFDAEPDPKERFGGGHGGIIQYREYTPETQQDIARLALLAVIAINEYYD